MRYAFGKFRGGVRAGRVTKKFWERKKIQRLGTWQRGKKRERKNRSGEQHKRGARIGTTIPLFSTKKGI